MYRSARFALFVFSGLCCFAEVFLLSNGHEVYKRQTIKCPACQSEKCAQKFEALPGHTACIPKAANAESWVMTQKIKQDIVDQHNRLRARVNPPAANMLKMYWDDEIAVVAQRWADACQTKDGHYFHDPVRGIPGRFGLGQNIGDGFKGFTEVTDAWYAEDVNYAPYFGTNITSLPTDKMVGHYTQMAWASSGLIGCGAAKCGNTNFFVCNYGPQGNYLPFASPYDRGASMGTKCKTKSSEGLCECNGVVCENESTMDVATCICKCDYPPADIAPTCRFKCNGKDAHFCGTQPGFMQPECQIPYMWGWCPNLCGLCPCAEPTYTPVYCPGVTAAPTSAPGGEGGATNAPGQGPMASGEPMTTGMPMTTTVAGNFAGRIASPSLSALPENLINTIVFCLPIVAALCFV